MAMEVGISALMQGDGVLRTQNLKEKKKDISNWFWSHWSQQMLDWKPCVVYFKVSCQWHSRHSWNLSFLKWRIPRTGWFTWCWSWFSLRRSWHPFLTPSASKTSCCRGVSDEFSVLRVALGDLEFTQKLPLCLEKIFFLSSWGDDESWSLTCQKTFASWEASKLPISHSPQFNITASVSFRLTFCVFILSAFFG